MYAASCGPANMRVRGGSARRDARRGGADPTLCRRLSRARATTLQPGPATRPGDRQWYERWLLRGCGARAVRAHHQTSLAAAAEVARRGGRARPARSRRELERSARSCVCCVAVHAPGWGVPSCAFNSLLDLGGRRPGPTLACAPSLGEDGNVQHAALPGW
jgi:hypothetical protein